jgi:PAS domain S-box-containing protein
MGSYPLLQWAECWGLAAALISERQLIEAVTPVLADWAGRPAGILTGVPVGTLFDGGGEDLQAFLRRCFRSRQRTLGTVTLKTESAPRPVRAEGALLIPRAPGAEACIGLLVRPQNEALGRFLEVSRRADAMNVEIARRQRIEADLVQQREWLRVTLSSIGDAVLATDARGCVVFLNRTAEQLTGWAASEALGRDASEVFTIHDEYTGQATESPVDRVLRERQIVDLTNHTVLVSRQGGSTPIDDSGAPIVNTRGEIVGVVLVFRDISERRRGEAHERAARLEADAANRAKDEFLATVSHELRTPLNALLGWTRLLTAGALQGERRDDAIATVMRNAEAQSRLLNQLLDMSRLVTGEIRLERSTVDFGELVARIVDSARPLALGKSVDLLFEPVRRPLLLQADSVRLQQVVWNLLSNALKFTPSGTIAVQLERDASVVALRVKDTGEGIAPDFLAHVFDRFTQRDASPTRPHGGLGIGLAIARHVIELHGGSIHVSSAGIGQGTTFDVRLPLGE